MFPLEDVDDAGYLTSLSWLNDAGLPDLALLLGPVGVYRLAEGVLITVRKYNVRQRLYELLTYQTLVRWKLELPLRSRGVFRPSKNPKNRRHG